MSARAALPFLLLAACGYTWGARATQERLPDGGGLPRVAVVPFDNLTYRRGLEIRLTRLVADELRARSPRAPRDPAEADWLLKGSVVRAEERVLSEDRSDVVRESEFRVTVHLVLEERSSGRVLRSYTLTETEPFSPRAGRIGTLQEAREELLRDLAERIVYWLEDRDPEPTS